MTEMIHPWEKLSKEELLEVLKINKEDLLTCPRDWYYALTIASIEANIEYLERLLAKF